MSRTPEIDRPFKLRGRLSLPPTPALFTATEVKALRQAHATGRFSISSLARTYGTSWATVNKALKDTYRPRMEY